MKRDSTNMVGVIFVAVVLGILLFVALYHLSSSSPSSNVIKKERIGWKYVEITQEVTPASIIDDSFFVDTHVWVRGFISSSDNLSSEFWDVDRVPRWKVEETKRDHENRAEEVYWKCVTLLRGFE
jgi:hypothetical protein